MTRPTFNLCERRRTCPVGDLAYRRTLDGELYGDEVEDVFYEDISGLEPDHREPLHGWLNMPPVAVTANTALSSW
jgi:hypothetical protein